MAAILRNSATVGVRTHTRVIPLAMITMRKSIHGFPFLSYMTMGLLLAGQAPLWNHVSALGTPHRLRWTGGFQDENTNLRILALNHFCIPLSVIKKRSEFPRNIENQFSHWVYRQIFIAITPGLIQHAKPNMICVVVFLYLVAILEVTGDCLRGNCQKISLDVYQDAVKDSEFVGHVFHNSVTLNPIQRHMKCIQDCRCLSLNYKETNDQKYCELNEGNHFTNKSSLKHSPGSRYYILRRDHGSEVMQKSLLCLLY